MGKKGTWFSAVRKALRSPAKEKEKDVLKSVPKVVQPVGNLPPVEVPVSTLSANSAALQWRVYDGNSQTPIHYLR